MSGEGRRSNQAADAQQFPPGGAESAPQSAGDAAGDDCESVEVRWVGEQYRMQGYCGRATYTGQAAAGGGASQIPARRPVVVVARQRRPVVRIGPRPIAAEEEPTARAA